MKEFINPEIELLELEVVDIMYESGDQTDPENPGNPEGGLGWG